nr:ATP-dependent DNA helicase UvrD2 [Propionibacteriales bacterium]
EIEWAKVSNVRPDDYPSVAASATRAVEGYDHATVGRVYSAYEEVKSARNRIDMEDVLLCAAAVLAEDERVASAVRRQYRWFVVDEFQDVSPIQSTLLDLWLGGRDEVCVVGDPAQTIYSFAGASADHLLGFGRKFPATMTITLTRNYRSTPEIVASANAVMTGQLGSSAVALRAVRGTGAAVSFTGHADEIAEAAAVATSIKTAVAAGTLPAHIAVLFRINAQSEAFEEALAEQGVPFVVRGVERFFDRPEVKQAIALLRGAARAEEQRSGDLVADVTDVLSSMGWTSAAPVGRGKARDRWESLQALVSVATDVLVAQPDVSFAQFVAELKRRADVQHAPVAEGVTLATLHTAKGLEWPTVFLTGLHEGTMPIVYADTPAAIDEERRLLYVGVTRARDRLQVSWAAARNPGGSRSRSASRFLAPLLDSGQRQAGQSRNAAARRRPRKAASLAACRVCSRPLTDTRERKLGRCSGCPSGYDEGLFDALRQWRRDRAASEKVPAYCIFTDATMTALAEMHPRDVAELVRVPGIGASKLDKYGGEILALCAADHPAADVH